MTSISTPLYELYCDESGIEAGPRFHLGALSCSPTRSEILTARLAQVRKQFGLSAEMKWTRVSRAMLAAYKAFVGVFLDCKFSRFSLHTVERGPQWHKFGRNEEQRFFKAYYVFLRLNMSLYRRYDVYVDDKPGKTYRWSNVEFSINRAVYRDHGSQKRPVRTFSPLDSKRCDLIQVTDITLGALTTVATSPHKQELAQYVRDHICHNRPDKLTHRLWSPQVNKAT
jgi:Protein of unknown function (DUF3800)